ncbi:MAG: ABC transporter ATP-binding protein [Hyphomicrobiales bacterium]|nr:ABC transporter ATP-binding protein [Hyphomicrobiales bacterium]
MTAALEIKDLSVAYGGAVQALSEASLTVPDGGFVVLLGANGAGKSTMLKAISGLLPFENGAITAGSVRFFGEDIAGIPSHRLARKGMLHVREGRCVFPSMSVEDNLATATFALDGRAPRTQRGFDDIYAYFPQLAARRGTAAGYLSGGEQQMLAIGRALVGDPRLLLVDEASLGLAPLIAREIFDILGRINQDRRLAILVVEQNVALALRHAAYGYILENGVISLEGRADTLMDREAISSRYLGGAHVAAAAH